MKNSDSGVVKIVNVSRFAEYAILPSSYTGATRRPLTDNIFSNIFPATRISILLWIDLARKYSCPSEFVFCPSVSALVWLFTPDILVFSDTDRERRRLTQFYFRERKNEFLRVILYRSSLSDSASYSSIPSNFSEKWGDAASRRLYKQKNRGRKQRDIKSRKKSKAKGSDIKCSADYQPTPKDGDTHKHIYRPTTEHIEFRRTGPEKS